MTPSPHPDNETTAKAWQAWREKVISYCLLLGSLLTFLSLVPSIVLLTFEEKHLLLWFSSGAFLVCMGLFALKRLPYWIRAWSVAILLLGMGVSIIFLRGPFTSGLLWCFLAAIACAVLINRGAAIGMCLVNLVLILTVALIIAGDPPESWNLLTHAPLINWGITGIIFMSLSLIGTLAINYLLQRTHDAFLTAHGNEHRLSVEMAEHRQTHLALQHSEQLFRTLVEASPLAIARLTEKGGYTYLNPRFTEVFGYTLADIPSDNAWFELAFPDPETRRDAIQSWQADITSLDKHLERIFPIRCKDGTQKQIRIRPVQIATGDYLITYEDITRQTALESQLRHAQKMEALGTLTGGIAHDFNNILNIIIGYTDLLLLDQDSQEIQGIQEAGLRARDIVKQLLTYMRKTVGESDFIDLGEILMRNIKLLRPTVPLGIFVSMTIQRNLPLIRGNACQMDQTCMNLMSNAVQACMPDGGTISAKVDTVGDAETGKQMVRITVEDTGQGVAPENIDRIFDPYFTTKPMGKSSGLGLSVVQGIVKGHYGTIDVQSVPGKGTLFDVRFPACKGQPKEKSSTSQQQLPAGSGTILLVDDEERAVEVTGKFLTRLGYEIKGFTHPREALTAFMDAPENFDLIITDMGMPEMTGDVLTKTAHTKRPDIPVIMCTGYHERVSRENFRDLGIDLLIDKPVDHSHLAGEIKRLISPERTRD
ncbi:MAG: response regulator [Desulfobacterales bacterium]|nr:response regulator [Desulfobacterales bacterium]